MEGFKDVFRELYNSSRSGDKEMAVLQSSNSSCLVSVGPLTTQPTAVVMEMEPMQIARL